MMPTNKGYRSIILKIIVFWEAEKRTHFAYILHVGKEWASKA